MVLGGEVGVERGLAEGAQREERTGTEREETEKAGTEREEMMETE